MELVLEVKGFYPIIIAIIAIIEAIETSSASISEELNIAETRLEKLLRLILGVSKDKTSTRDWCRVHRH